MYMKDIVQIIPKQVNLECNVEVLCIAMMHIGPPTLTCFKYCSAE